MARRCSATAPSSFGSASTPQCTKPLALRRRCKSPGPDCRRLLQKAGGTRVPSRALYETTGGGAGPVGTQQHPRRLSRRAGGGTRRGGADRDLNGHPKSRTNGGNGPKVDIPFPRRNTRLESRWGNLEAMRSSRRAQRTRTCCRAPSSRSCGPQESPLHGVARRDMAIGRRRLLQNRLRQGNSSQKGLSRSSKRHTTVGPRNMSGSRSRTWSARRLERAVRPYWGISAQKQPKNGWGRNMGNSMPWGNVGECRFAK